MRARVIKQVAQGDDGALGSYRIVEVTSDADLDGKYLLEYQTLDSVGAPQWRLMCATNSALTDPDPLAVLLRELRKVGWF